MPQTHPKLKETGVTIIQHLGGQLSTMIIREGIQKQMPGRQEPTLKVRITKAISSLLNG